MRLKAISSRTFGGGKREAVTELERIQDLVSPSWHMLRGEVLLFVGKPRLS